MWTVQILDAYTNKPLNIFVGEDHGLVKILTSPNVDNLLKFDKIGNCMKFCVELMEHQFEPQFDNFPTFKAKVFRI